MPFRTPMRDNLRINSENHQSYWGHAAGNESAYESGPNHCKTYVTASSRRLSQVVTSLWNSTRQCDIVL